MSKNHYEIISDAINFVNGYPDALGCSEEAVDFAATALECIQKIKPSGYIKRKMVGKSIGREEDQWVFLPFIRKDYHNLNCKALTLKAKVSRKISDESKTNICYILDIIIEEMDEDVRVRNTHLELNDTILVLKYKAIQALKTALLDKEEGR